MAQAKWGLSRLATSAGNAAIIVAVLVVTALGVRGHISLGSAPVSSQIRDLLLVAVICGVGSSASIEIAKRIFGLRGFFQRRQVRKWLESRVADTAMASAQPFGQLLAAMSLAAGDRRLRADELRLFNLPTEQLAAQISDAAEVALESPRNEYLGLLAALAGGGRDYMHQLYVIDSERGNVPGNVVTVLPEDLAQRVRVGIDQLQISIGERWRQYVQGVAVWLAGVYGYLLVRALPPAIERGPFGRPTPDYRQERFVLVGLLLGGPLAWLIRDLTAVVERARRR